MASKYTVVADHVKIRRWDQGGESTDEVERVEKNGMCPIPPGAFEIGTEALAMDLEPLLGDWWSRDIAAQSLETSSAITAVDGDAGVDIDTPDIGDICALLGDEADGTDELASGLTWSITEELAITGRCPIARRQHELLAREVIIGVELVERTTMPGAHAGESLVCPLRNLGDLFEGGICEGMKAELAVLVPDVDTVEGEGMKVHVHPERGVRALHERDGAYLGVLDRAQIEAPLGSRTE